MSYSGKITFFLLLVFISFLAAAQTSVPGNKTASFASSNSSTNSSSIDSVEQIVVLLFKIELLAMRFDQLSLSASSLSDYYAESDGGKQKLWSEIAEDFKSLATKMRSIKNIIKNNGSKLDESTISLMKEAIQEVKTSMERIALKIINAS